jgi:UDP-N-acetylglucosamine pyrophosphorylase
LLRKLNLTKKLALICKVEDKFQVVEYSEISEVTRNLRDKEDDLLYNAGNICNNFLDTEFLSYQPWSKINYKISSLAQSSTGTKYKNDLFLKTICHFIFKRGPSEVR